MSKVYSYIRFSSPEQAKGNSLQRQLEASQKYCLQNNLVLDDSLNLHDLGVSAFKGSNATEGRLAAFIQAVDDGVVEPGSTLLVESLDRISRSDVLTALNLFTSILSKGVTIVTLSDNKTYTKENISDISNLLFSLIIMSRAHDESATKSLRVKAAWDNKKKQAIEKGVPLTKMCPGWLEIVDGKYSIRTGAGAAIKRIYELYNQGLGYMSIVKQMNQEHPTFTSTNKKSSSWNQSYIVRIIETPAVYGEFQSIPDYFPAVLSKEQWQFTQSLKAERQGTGGRKATLVNLFSHITKCGYCGGSMVRLNKSGFNKNSKKTYSYVGMACNNGRKGLTECGAGAWNMIDLEELLLTNITELDVAKIVGGVDRKLLDQIEQSIKSIEYEKAQNDGMKTNLVAAITMGGELDVLVTKLKDIEIQTTELDEKLKGLQDAHTSELTRYKSAVDSQENIMLLRDKLDDGQVRIFVNQEIKKLVDKIVLWVPKKRFNIFYKTSVLKSGFKSGKVVLFEETDGDWLGEGDL